MKLTREKLAELHRLTREVNEKKEIASENLKTVQDRFGHLKHKLQREGKEIELTEKIMWDEVFYVGPSSDSGQILRQKYPKVFEYYKIQNDKAAELRQFCMEKLELDYTQMTISDYLRMTESMFELLGREGKIKPLSIKPGLKVKVKNLINKLRIYAKVSKEPAQGDAGQESDPEKTV